MDPFGKSLLGGNPVEQRDELLAFGGLEAATELLLVLQGDLHDFAEERLDSPPVTFPSDHGAIVSRPREFAETLHEILIG